ncbi:MAG: rhomboid family intramembrane serine protease [Planctomycetota bacterium]|nr:MAG: rhomboid family intramembrane serine protease [Planctomycetota bacterium]
MSWRDRPYSQDEPSQPELRLSFRKPSTAVTWLIIANAVVYIIQLISLRWNPVFFLETFGLSLAGISQLYFWQPVTYMFLHSPFRIFHILVNMLMLYVCGSEFERAFGRQRFLQFYFTCGIVGGLAYLALSALYPGEYFIKPLVGASGAVYGLLMAAIIFFPHIQVILFIIPMPIRVFGLIVAAILLLQIVGPGGVENPGGEVCHLAGAATGVVIFYVWGIMPRIRIGSGEGTLRIPFGLGKLAQQRREGAWARKQKKLASEQADVDRILAKVKQQGIQSLTHKEKKNLARATQRQKEQDRQFGRTDRL